MGFYGSRVHRGLAFGFSGFRVEAFVFSVFERTPPQHTHTSLFPFGFGLGAIYAWALGTQCREELAYVTPYPES